MTKQIFIAGPAGIGKTTTGKALADLINMQFYDLDDEIESFFEAPLARVQAKLSLVFHAATAAVLRHVLAKRRRAALRHRAHRLPIAVCRCGHRRDGRRHRDRNGR